MFLAAPNDPVNQKKRVIFGFPRSGTKLLADAHVQNGYHSFGEIFDTFTNSIKIEENKLPSAFRKTRAEQLAVKKDKQVNVDRHFYKHSVEIRSQRVPIFLQYLSCEPSILTMWLETPKFAPEILSALDDRLFLCTRRTNRFENLLSRCITSVHQNYNAEIPSSSIRISLNAFEMFYYRLREVTWIQNQLVAQNRGYFVDFDELIQGFANLGFSYEVTSKDQHKDLQALVINIDNVQDRFYALSKRFPMEDPS